MSAVDAAIVTTLTAGVVAYPGVKAKAAQVLRSKDSKSMAKHEKQMKAVKAASDRSIGRNLI